MSTTRDAFSPTGSWETQSEDMDDDMDYELANDEVTPAAEDGTAVEEDEEEGPTLYFDAEEGTLRNEDGEEVTFEVDDGEEEADDDDDDDEGGPEEGEEAAEDEGEGQEASAPQPAHTTTDPPGRAGTRTINMTQAQLLQLLSHAGLRGIFQNGITTRSHGRARHVALDDDDDEEEDEDDEDYLDETEDPRQRLRRRQFVGDRYPPIPSETGAKLMQSGNFGHNDRCRHTACGVPLSAATQRQKRKLSYRMLHRELGLESRGRNNVYSRLASQSLIPGNKADLIVNLNARCYSGQFSEDGSFFFACGQDFQVRMYDTSNPYDWKYYKTVHYYGGQWTITDASLSPDNKLLAYSSIRSQICLARTDKADQGEPQMLDFSDMGGGNRGGRNDAGWGRSRGHFGIWSLRFSGDGSEIVAGTSDQSVYVYDLESQRSILRIPGHQDDVNAVCFGDRMSPHILYSGSDDTTLKVWDRRSLASMRPAGMFLGHTEGLTYIDSKGDGRYVISNAKDQTCKLWDLRKMISTDQGERINPQEFTTHFDYRFSPYSTSTHTPHPHDCSLVTFRGHRVLKTLIRCHFSPATSTDSRYIYSGSHDGKIYIWNLDGTEAGTINVLQATKGSRPLSDERFVDRYDYYGRGGVWKTIVRDASWHPSAPVIAATSWNGWDHGLGTCTVHSWNDGVSTDENEDEDEAEELKSGEAYERAETLGNAPMGARVTAHLQHDQRFYDSPPPARAAQARRSTRLRDRMGLGALFGGADVDDE